MKKHGLSRRGFARLLGAGAGAAVLAPTGVAVLPGDASERTLSKGEGKLYGLIGKMTAVSGQRDTLIEILLGGVSAMSGCLSYVVAKDSVDENALWITEVWDGQESHAASLSLPLGR